MSEITLSTMTGSRQGLSLERFEAHSPHRVRHILFPWASAWNELLSIGLHNRGPDISQVGTTWLGSLVGMQSLRPFTDSEITRIRGGGDFIPAAWTSSMIPGEAQHYAIPWIADTRLFLYRRDLLDKAGIDEAHAFESHEALVDTLRRLQAAGIEMPLALSTREEVVHNAAPWVWGAGGHFRSPDRRRLTFTDEKVLLGIEQFYSLHRFLSPPARGLTIMQLNDLFVAGQAAVILTVHNLIPQLVFHTPPVYGLANIGAAVCPGIPFIGGSSLVIWRHTTAENAALDLIRFLSTPEAQQSHYLHTSELPTRIDALESDLFKTNPLFKAVAQSLKTGRAFQSGYQWATVETRLSSVLNQLWQDLFQDPSLDLRGEIASRLGDISSRLERTLFTR